MTDEGAAGDAITTRPWAPGDDVALNELWGDAESPAAERSRDLFAPSAPGAEGGAGWRHCVVAEVSGLPVAAAVVSRGELHPTRLWCHVEVAATERRRGLGTRLLGELRHAVAGSPCAGTHLRARVAEGSTGEAFARAGGFHPLQRSRIVRVLPAARGHEVLRSAAPAGGLPAGTELRREASGGVAVTRAVEDWYRASHDWDPVADLSVGAFNRAFLADAHEVLVLRRDGGIADFAVVFGGLPAGDPGPVGEDEADVVREDLEVLVGGVPGRGSVRGRRLLLDQLLALHHGPVVLEVDEGMTDLWQVTGVLLGADLAEQAETPTVVLGD